jgi:hypothetical protein
MSIYGNYHYYARYMNEHVDVISQGALTQGYSVLDFSMKLPRPEAMAAGGEEGDGLR